MDIWSILVISVLTIFVVFDIWCYYSNRPTLSRRVTEWTRKYPILPFITGFIVGLLAGHWWWPLGGLPFSGIL